MPKIHPTAQVHKDAELAEGVAIGPFSVIESDVSIGEGTVIRENVIVRRHTTLGAHNMVDAFTVLGGEPQDLKFDAESKTYLRIGDHNVFREHVTISRATGEGHATEVGSHTYWMTHSHAGHNAKVGDHCILVNGAALAGHAEIDERVILSAHTVVHQFTRVGKMVMAQGNSGASAHVPPYCMMAGINRLAGLNVVGLQRAPHITREDRMQIKEAYRLVFRSGMPPIQSLAAMDEHEEWGEPVSEFREFVRWVLQAKPPYNRGLAQTRARRGGTR